MALHPRHLSRPPRRRVDRDRRHDGARRRPRAIASCWSSRPAASSASTRPTRSHPARPSPTGASPSCTPRPRSSASTGSSSSATATRAWPASRRTTTTGRSRAPTSTRPRPGSPRILREEHADVLTVYDDHGNYGHPDHVQVHRVGVRAAELAGTRRVYESTMNRDYIRGLMERARRRDARRARAPDAARDGRLRLARVDHHHDRRRARLRRPQARRDGRAREPDPGRLVLLGACRPTRSARRSAPSGSSAATRRDARETWLFDDL